MVPVSLAATAPPPRWLVMQFSGPVGILPLDDSYPLLSELKVQGTIVQRKSPDDTLRAPRQHVHAGHMPGGWANIRGIRKTGVQVIKKSIPDVGFSKSSFIKCYEVLPVSP